jgi:anti-anti-sigma factor
VLDVERNAVRLRVPFDALDLATSDAFLQWARGGLACAPADTTTVVLDFGAVEFLMAAGVRALLDLERELCIARRSLVVAGAAPIVVRVLQICAVADRWLIA